MVVAELIEELREIRIVVVVKIRRHRGRGNWQPVHVCRR